MLRMLRGTCTEWVRMVSFRVWISVLELAGVGYGPSGCKLGPFGTLEAAVVS